LNDPSSGIGPERTRENYVAMIAAIQQADARPVVMAPPLPSSDAELRRTTAELNLPSSIRTRSFPRPPAFGPSIGRRTESTRTARRTSRCEACWRLTCTRPTLLRQGCCPCARLPDR
jgi:hypothetical protein